MRMWIQSVLVLASLMFVSGQVLQAWDPAKFTFLPSGCWVPNDGDCVSQQGSACPFDGLPGGECDLSHLPQSTVFVTYTAEEGDKVDFVRVYCDTRGDSHVKSIFIQSSADKSSWATVTGLNCETFPDGTMQRLPSTGHFGSEHRFWRLFYSNVDTKRYKIWHIEFYIDKPGSTPTPSPTPSPTPAPSLSPTPSPTPNPTTPNPTPSPTDIPTPSPKTPNPTVHPTTPNPTPGPTPSPTDIPTPSPTTPKPTVHPTPPNLTPIPTPRPTPRPTPSPENTQQADTASTTLKPDDTATPTTERDAPDSEDSPQAVSSPMEDDVDEVSPEQNAMRGEDEKEQGDMAESLSLGAIVGIAAGACVCGLVVAAVGAMMWKKQGERQRQQGESTRSSTVEKESEQVSERLQYQPVPSPGSDNYDQIELKDVSKAYGEIPVGRGPDSSYVDLPDTMRADNNYDDLPDSMRL